MLHLRDGKPPSEFKLPFNKAPITTALMRWLGEAHAQMRTAESKAKIVGYWRSSGLLRASAPGNRRSRLRRLHVRMSCLAASHASGAASTTTRRSRRSRCTHAALRHLAGRRGGRVGRVVQLGGGCFGGPAALEGRGACGVMT